MPAMITNSKSDSKANTTKRDDYNFRLRILPSLKKMVDLPPMSIWDRLSTPDMVMRARLSLHTRTKGLFFHDESDEMWRQCLLSEKGYLIIYAKETALKGYALNIAQAKKVKFSCKKIPSTKSNYNRYSSQLHNSVVTIKWSFGAVCLTLPTCGAERWRQTILNCFTGSPQRSSGLDTSPANTIKEGKEADAISPTCSATQVPSKCPNNEAPTLQPEAADEPPMHNDQPEQSPQAAGQDKHNEDDPPMHSALSSPTKPDPSPQLINQDQSNADASTPQVDSSSSVQLIFTAVAHIQINRKQFEMIRQHFEKETRAGQDNCQDPK
jgi:hypothetical protein